MAEFQEVMKRYSRMCFGIGCSDCPIRHANTHVSCTDFLKREPAEAERIIMDWAAANPVQTMMQDFFEKFPNAKKKADGHPDVCPDVLGYEEESLCKNGACLACWSRTLSEVVKPK